MIPMSFGALHLDNETLYAAGLDIPVRENRSGQPRIGRAEESEGEPAERQRRLSLLVGAGQVERRDMEIGLIDVDSHNYPNLALMKISAWHKERGDHVEWWNGLKHYDRVYQAKVFDESYTKDNEFVIQADEIIKGGTGYDLDNKLPNEIEHIMPDYLLYGISDTAYGFLTRGCPRHCKFCIVGDKEGLVSHKVADLSEFWNGQKNIEILDPNLLACKDRSELLEQLIESGG